MKAARIAFKKDAPDVSSDNIHTFLSRVKPQGKEKIAAGQRAANQGGTNELVAEAAKLGEALAKQDLKTKSATTQSWVSHISERLSSKASSKEGNYKSK
jgi:hypothetical protein